MRWEEFLVSAALSLVDRNAVVIGVAANGVVASAMEVVCEARASHPEGSSSTLPR